MSHLHNATFFSIKHSWKHRTSQLPWRTCKENIQFMYIEKNLLKFFISFLAIFFRENNIVVCSWRKLHSEVAKKDKLDVGCKPNLCMNDSKPNREPAITHFCLLWVMAVYHFPTIHGYFSTVSIYYVQQNRIRIMRLNNTCKYDTWPCYACL